MSKSAIMRNKLMAGVCRYLLGVPPFLWEKQIEKAVQKVKRSTGFMSPEKKAQGASRILHFSADSLFEQSNSERFVWLVNMRKALSTSQFPR